MTTEYYFFLTILDEKARVYRNMRRKLVDISHWLPDNDPTSQRCGKKRFDSQ